MKRTLCITLALMTGAVPALAAQAPAPGTLQQPEAVGPLTLEEAIAQALLVSPRLEITRSGTASARAQKRAARAEGRPQVTVGGSGAAQGPAVTFPGGGSLTPGRIGQGTADLSVPLYTGGRVKAGKKAASAAERAALARVEAEAQALVLEVTQAYVSALEAQQQT
ncbi:MAG: hypothetical protein K0Q72_1499, partial [Armatimonadetes bacterium]|nr:hypothetical protein [Armatimonadota bacterium]